MFCHDLLMRGAFGGVGGLLGKGIIFVLVLCVFVFHLPETPAAVESLEILPEGMFYFCLFVFSFLLQDEHELV